MLCFETRIHSLSQIDPCPFRFANTPLPTPSSSDIKEDGVLIHTENGDFLIDMNEKVNWDLESQKKNRMTEEMEYFIEAVEHQVRIKIQPE